MDTKLVVFVALVIDLISFTIILPVFPSILRKFAENESDTFYQFIQSLVTHFREIVGTPDTPRWNSVLFGGLIGSSFSLMQYLSAPFIGSLSDVYGRKKVLIFTMIINSFSHILWAYSNSFSLFMAARLLAGVSESNASLSIAILTDVTNVKERGKAMALVGIAFSIAFIIGPVIGVVLASSNSFVVPSSFCLMLSVAVILFLMIFLRESLPLEKRRKSVLQEASNSMALINPISLFNFDPVLLNKKESVKVKFLGRIYFLYLFIYSGLEFTLGFFTFFRFNYDNNSQGKMFFFIGIIMTLTQGGFTRRVKPGKELKTALIAILLLIPTFTIIGFSYSLLQFYSGLAMYAFSSAIVVPTLTTMVTKLGEENQKGVLTGVLRSLGSLARCLGPFVSCFIYWSFGPIICYSLASVSMLFLYLHFSRNSKTIF